MAQLNTTELDFDVIKQNLIRYFQRSDGPFKDWNFTGSGLNHLLDVLAYNTHYNAMLAHTSLNESYLDSAQVRANVVSHAKSLGYTPRSKNAARSTVNLVFNKSTNAGSQYVLPKGTKFSAVVGSKTHTFVTAGEHTESSEGTQFVFNDIELIQGAARTQTFVANNVTGQEERYVINNKNVDTSTIEVLVYDSITSASYSVYQKFNTLAEITSASKVYYLNENTDGKYEISFGNNIFGRAPNSSSRIVVNYSVTNGTEANGANDFTYADTSNEVDIASVVTVSSASGGAEPENKASIKFNAPLNFSAQDRAVTTADYKSLVKSQIPGIEDILAWGGEENEVINYGSVYLCAKPVGANNLTTEQKERIQSFLQNKKIIGTRIEIVDATFTYLQFDITFAYDRNATNLNVGELETKMRNGIKKYNSEQLNNFNANFRLSRFLRELDNTDSSILNTNASTTAYKEAAIVSNSVNNLEINFGFKLAGAINQTSSMIRTSVKNEEGSGTQFKELFGGQDYNVELRDRPVEGSTTIRQIYSILADETESEVIINDNVGNLYPETGLIEIQNFVGAANTTIRFSVIPNDFDVYTDKRNLLQIDETRTSITGIIDRSGTTTGGQTYAGGSAGTTTGLGGY